ncbi:glycosyltransferase family 2 protein [Proteus mirabilis]|nr:glycosyltransferase [Proteus mirabilis]HEA4455161.1 glycosyltransferase [Proteus mirabilis]
MKNENNKPLVSVIIPCYNHEKFVQECIQSIIDQSYQNLELIIIDDGSSDKSVKKIKDMYLKCKEHFVRFEFRYRPNKGLSATLNEGLEWISGEYVCSVASDDIWVNNKVSLQVDYLNNNPQCLGVFGNVNLIDEYSQHIKYIKHKSQKFTFEDILFHNFYLPAPTNMCRTVAVKQYLYDPDIIIEDWFMWLKLSEKGGTLDYIDSNLASYRQHSHNTSKKNQEMMNARLDVLNHFKHHKNINYAKACAYLIGANDNLPYDRNISLSHYVRYLRSHPVNLFRLKSIKYLAKYIFK